MAEGDIKGPVCPKCGRLNPPQNRFCGSCGAPLADASLPPTPLVVPPQQPNPPVLAPPQVASSPAPASSVPTSSSPAAKKKAEADELAALLIAQAKIQNPVAKTPKAKSRTPEIPNVPPPALAPRPKVPPKPVELLPVPADPLTREREREKLLTQASAFRVKGQVTDARETLQKAIPFFEGRPPQEAAPIHEQIGDLLETEEFDEEAMASYETAFTLDPKRVGADRKRAALALSLATRRNPNLISAALLRGENLTSILGEGTPLTKRNAGLAMFLSVVFPGFGQLYNAQIIKGGVLMAIAVVSLFVISASGDRDALFHNIAAVFALRKGGAAPSNTTIFFLLSYLVAWLYSIVDAPFFAGKAGSESIPRHDVDKSGWEV